MKIILDAMGGDNAPQAVVQDYHWLLDLFHLSVFCIWP